LNVLDTEENYSKMETLTRNVDKIWDKISTTPRKTLVHGDCKTSNLFFHKQTGRYPLSALSSIFCLSPLRFGVIIFQGGGNRFSVDRTST
jgi:hypothetical protein